jgi:Na+/H+ antiporter NhaD/arsenite permease-like protein
MTKFLPIGFILMLAVYFGLHTIYEWTHTDIVANDPILSQKTAWLNEPGFMIRMVIIFAVWILFAWRQRTISQEADANPAGYNVKRVMATSSIGLIGFFSSNLCCCI